MPLMKGSSKKAISSNISELARSIKKRPHDQIIAIALQMAGKKKKK